MSYKDDIFVIYSALTSKKSFNAFCKDINSLSSKFSNSYGHADRFWALALACRKIEAVVKRKGGGAVII